MDTPKRVNNVTGKRYGNATYMNNKKKAILNKMRDVVSTDDELKNVADNLGINPNFTKSGRLDAIRGVQDDSGKISQKYNEEIKEAIKILRSKDNNGRSFVNSNDGTVYFDSLKNWLENTPEGEKAGMSFNELMKLKDFIDSFGLRYLYDPSVVSKRRERIGVKVNGDDFNFDNLDLNNYTEDEIVDWRDAPDKEDRRKYRWSLSDEEARNEYKKSILNKYIVSQYGIELTVPDFSKGNAKVYKALMINFTSAFRCPAWNECLVKHACYARAGEARQYNQKMSNDKKNLMWLAAMKDDTLLKLVSDYLKTCAIDYNQFANEIAYDSEMFSSACAFLGVDENTAYVPDVVEMLISKKFAEIPEDVLNGIKKCLLVRSVRVNENGDFINQNLLDMFDELAGDFRCLGITVAAYSCRNLNFENIKNIIINASRVSMSGDAIKRYFYAIPKSMYREFPDTYEEMNIGSDFDAIKKTPKPLYRTVNGVKKFSGMYYKCPCGRSDFSIAEAKTDAKKISCYQCSLCYGDNTDEMKEILKNTGEKFFVFVEAHGTHANVLDEKRANQIIQTVGVPEGYNVNLRSDGSEGMNDVVESRSFRRINESIEPSYANDDEAFRAIAGNAVRSMTDKFRKMNESCKFNDMLTRINEVFKR